jgi:RimJ/RimL family protein N-acetyltransferase
MAGPISERLAWRLPRREDAADAMVLLRDPDVVRWNPAPAVVDEASALAWCLSGADWSGGDHATWHGVDPLTDRLVVNISLFGWDAEHATAKIGYRVMPGRRGRGFATEALCAVSTWAFAERSLARIQLEHAVPNAASCRAALSAGFAIEGILRSAFRTPEGERCDEHVHGRLASDLRPVPPAPPRLDR